MYNVLGCFKIWEYFFNNDMIYEFCSIVDVNPSIRNLKFQGKITVSNIVVVNVRYIQKPRLQ